LWLAIGGHVVAGLRPPARLVMLLLGARGDARDAAPARWRYVPGRGGDRDLGAGKY